MVFVFLYGIHIFHSLQIRSRILDLQNADGVSFSTALRAGQLPTLWTFGAVTVVLPLGLSLVSTVFAPDGIVDSRGEDSLSLNLLFTKFLFHFCKAVFFVMITLEISYLYNLERDVWRHMLIAALVLDMVSFALVSLIGELRDAMQTISLTSLFFIGSFSFISSFIILYYSRTFDLFSRDLRIQTNGDQGGAQ